MLALFSHLLLSLSFAFFQTSADFLSTPRHSTSLRLRQYRCPLIRTIDREIACRRPQAADEALQLLDVDRCYYMLGR